MAHALRISLAQVTGSESPAKNLEIAGKYIRSAAQEGANLIVFPEMFMALPSQQTPLAQIAEPLDGNFVSGLGHLAKEYNLHVISGVWEQLTDETGKAGNCAIVLDNHGSLLAAYRKIHLFNALNVRESDLMEGGNTPPPIFSINGLKLSIAICYDLRFPELFRNAAQQHVDGVVVPSAWYAGPMKETHWLTLLRARAIENTMYAVGVNLCGTSFCGRSTAYDPFGACQCDGGETENLVSFTMTKRRVTEVRQKLPSLANSRSELFYPKQMQ
jgi:predicted amidohydrolase